MKRSAWVILACVALSAAGARAEDGFDRLKSLAGKWETKGPDGSPIQVTFTVTSQGTAVMEHMSFNDMVTMYHRDGERVMLTHYCGIGNQPRMRTEAAAGGARSLAFRFHDATNLAKPDLPYMKNLTITFVDADHITEEWTHAQGGQEMPMKLELTRLK